MKNFEGWYILEGQNIVGHYDYKEEDLAKLAWRAALEWVLEKADSGCCQCGCIEESIMKELDFSEEENSVYELWGRQWKQKMKEHYES